MKTVRVYNVKDKLPDRQDDYPVLLFGESSPKILCFKPGEVPYFYDFDIDDYFFEIYRIPNDYRITSYDIDGDYCEYRPIQILWIDIYNVIDGDDND